MYPEPLKLDGHFQYFEHKDDEYKKIDILTDYFTEKQRMESVRIDQIPNGKSPLDIWKSGSLIYKNYYYRSYNKSTG